MKIKKVVYGTVAVAGVMYFVIEAMRHKFDRLYRVAAGESQYENTHRKEMK